MDYYKAQNIRKKGLISMMTERLSSGMGTGAAIKSSISDKTRATFTGIKQRFDPLNIARVVTGGSKFAPALLGAMTKRSKRDIGFFTGKKERAFSGLKGSSLQGSGDVAQYLGQIYDLLAKIENDRKLELQERQNKQEEIESEENRRNQAIIQALTARKKAKPSRKETKKLDDANKKISKEKKKTDEITGVTPPTAPKPTAAPTPAPTAPKPTAAPAPAPAPKPPAPTPTAPAPKPPAPKPPTAGKVVGGAAILGGAVAATGLLIGKESLAANISKYESGKAGYNAYNKGTVGNKMIPSDKPIDFSKMTITEYLRRGDLKKDDPDRLFAVGKYQIIPTTMRELIKQLKLDPDTTYLDPATQDLLFTNGLVGVRRKKVDAYVKGKSDDKDGAILELAKEFASVGIPYDMTVGNKQLKKGDSYYSGIGGNKAHNSPEQVGAALDADRLKNMRGGNKSSAVTDVPTGNKIDTETKENVGLKKSFQESPATSKSVNNTNISSKTVASNEPNKEDDTNPLIKKARTA